LPGMVTVSDTIEVKRGRNRLKPIRLVQRSNLVRETIQVRPRSLDVPLTEPKVTRASRRSRCRSRRASYARPR
jgi:hypothetical protein